MDVGKKSRTKIDKKTVSASKDGRLADPGQFSGNLNTGFEQPAEHSLLQTTLDNSFNYIQVFKAVRDKNDKITDFIWVLNNRKLAELQGDRVGKSLVQLNPGVVPSGLFDLFVQVTESGIPQTNEVYYEYEGFHDWFHQTIVKLNDGLVVTGEIITERKKAEQEMLKLKDELAQKATDRYLTIFNSIDEGFHINEVIFDKNNKAIDIAILEENPAAIKILGGSFAGKTIKELKRDYPEERLEIWADVVQSGESRRMAFYSHIWERWLDLHVTKLGDEHSNRVALVFQDISERKCAEEALRKSEAKLAMDLADTKLLQSLSSLLITEDNVHTIYEQLLNAATEIMHSNMGSIQLFVPEKNELFQFITKGFDEQAVKQWEWIKMDSGTICCEAFKENKRVVVPDIESSEFLANTENLKGYRSAGIRAAQSTPLITRSGNIVGMISTHWRERHEPAERELRLLDILARQAADVVERKQKEDTLRKTQERLAEELADTKKLQAISSRLIERNSIGEIYEEILNTACDFMHSDMSSLQVLSFDKDELNLLAYKGFHPDSAKFWRTVEAGSASVCGVALEQNKRIIIPDVETWEYIQGTNHLDAYRLSGIRTVQSTPLISLSGHIVGMISTHWRTVYEPTDREFRLLDVLARQAADLIERKLQEEKYLAQLQTEVHDRTIELKESKELLQSIAEAIPDMINVQAYPSRKMIYYNRDPYNVNGFSIEELSKMTLEERHALIHPDDIEELKKYVAGFASFSDNNIATIEYRSKNKQGDWTWLRARGRVFERDEKGNVTSIVNVIQNITTQKNIEEEVAIQHKILKQAEDLAKAGSWEYDIRAKELFWSDGMYALFHTKKSNHIKPNIYLEHTTEQDRAIAKKIVDNIVQDFKPFQKTIHLKFNGQIKTIRIKAAPLKNDKGEIEKMLGVDLDITSVQESEEKIRELNRSLFAINKELSSINAELKNFNAITANNYTEALRKIYVNLESIATTDARNLSDTSKGNIRKAQASIQKMKLLTNDIHNYLELYDAGIKKDLISANGSLHSIIDNMKDKIHEAKASFEMAELPELSADLALFSRLVKNLIDNSIKFRKPGEPPVIKISYKKINELNSAPLTMTGRPYTIITVSDNGIGFENTDKIFELFTQLQDQGKYKGSGMGLSVCKKIMELHGGFIVAEAEPGKGASFHCYFPE